jgi:methylated-DNA-[protein]-cysteine S-methyltransferase
MNAYVIVDSPIGCLLLQTDGVSLTGLYMDVPGRPIRGMNDWLEDPTAGPLPDAVRQLEEYFAGKRRRLRSAAAPGRYRIPAARLACAHGNSVRGNMELR